MLTRVRHLSRGASVKPDTWNRWHIGVLGLLPTNYTNKVDGNNRNVPSHSSGSQSSKTKLSAGSHSLLSH